jgi:hypothetical protein
LFEGEFAKNLSFNRKAMEQRTLANNAGSNGDQFEGGDTAYMGRILWGQQKPTQLGDYNVYVAYKYLETDSVLDALDDSKFHMGGTNAKGYILSGSVNVGANTVWTAYWSSAKQVTGAPYAVDVVETELTTSF